MPYPNYPNKTAGTPVLSAEQMVAYRRGVGRFPRVAPPKGMIICLETSLPKKAARQHPTRKVGRFIGDALVLRRTRDQVGVMVNLGFGAPTVAALAEELIAWGVQRLALVSLCGGLRADLAEGQIVVCERAIRDEGTSYHYLPAEKYALPDPDLTTGLTRSLQMQGAPYLTGTTWSIDATYRETREEVTAYQAEGALTVEMETAALLSVGRVRGVPCAAITVVGDNLAREPWRPPTDFKRMDRSLLIAYSAAIDALQAA